MKIRSAINGQKPVGETARSIAVLVLALGLGGHKETR